MQRKDVILTEKGWASFCLPKAFVEWLGLLVVETAVLLQLRSILLKTGLECLVGSTEDPCLTVSMF